jgi:pimeloyl-ACP methyl ester carboxylesterase
VVGHTGHDEAFAGRAAIDGRAGDEFDPMDVVFHDVPAEVLAEAMSRGEPPQSSRPFEDPWPLSRWPDVPTRFLQATDDRSVPVEVQRRVVHERLGLAVKEMPGGHLVALSLHAELAKRLMGYL